MDRGCACIAEVNKKLADHNGILNFNMLSAPPRAMVAVTKLKERERKKPPMIEASYCPFCGTRYHDRKDLASALAATPNSPDPGAIP